MHVQFGFVHVLCHVDTLNMHVNCKCSSSNLLHGHGLGALKYSEQPRRDLQNAKKVGEVI